MEKRKITIYTHPNNVVACILINIAGEDHSACDIRNTEYGPKDQVRIVTSKNSIASQSNSLKSIMDDCMKFGAVEAQEIEVDIISEETDLYTYTTIQSIELEKMDWSGI